MESAAARAGAESGDAAACRVCFLVPAGGKFAQSARDAAHDGVTFAQWVYHCDSAHARYCNGAHMRTVEK